MIVEAVKDLYVARWGYPSRRAEFELAGWSMEILKWDPDANPEGVALYVTAGASSAPTADLAPGHRVEFFCGLLPPQDEVAHPLAILATYSAREGVPVGHGHTLRLAETLWESTPMTAFLVMRPLAGILSPLELAGGVHVEFLQAIPVFDSELAFKAKHGAEALIRRWEDLGVRFWDPNRAPEPGESSDP